MNRWWWVVGASVLVGCPTGGDPDTGVAVDAATDPDAFSVDAAALDAAGIDAPGLDAFADDAAEHDVGLDAPGLDAPSDDTALDAPTAPSDASVTDAAPVSDPRILALSVGKYGTCVIDRMHRLWCWGSGSPAQVADWTDVSSVDVGVTSTCATRADGLWCWGSNAALGASPVPTPTRVTLPLPLPITALAVGLSHICATAADGTHCWGTGLAALDSDGVAPIATLPATVALAAGEGFGCAIDSVGALRCWGRNLNGELGDGTVLDRRRPVAVSSISDVLDVQVGVQSGCAGAALGGWCWGWNATGNLGDGTVTESHTPVTVLGGPYVEVTTGWYHGVGLRSDGSLWQWGMLRHSESVAPVLTPQRVLGVPPASHVEAGQDHTCALADDGEVYCWGAGGFIGRPGGESREGLRVTFPCEPACTAPDMCVEGACVPPPPPPPTGDAGVLGAAIVSLSGRCAVHATGLVTCWGMGYFGDGAGTASSSLPRVVPIGSAIEVTTNDSGVCVLLDDGSVYCWGSNVNGDVGDGTTATRLSPTRAVDLPPIAHIGGNSRVRVAVATDGSVWLWGDDTTDLARTGTAGLRPRPTRVEGISGALAGALGSIGLCTLHVGGTVRCWAGGTTAIETMTTDPSITAITAGTGFGCARGTEVRCWGTVPVFGDRTGATPVTELAGARAVCAVRDEMVVVDSFGDTYAFRTTGRLAMGVPIARTCSSGCIIGENEEAWCSSSSSSTWSRRRTL